MKLLEEFRKFAFKGNVADMAVGIIVGGAFGKIVSSMVSDLIMPLFGILLGGINFSSLRWVMVPATGEKPELALMYGSFIQSVTDFLIIAGSIFLFIRIMNQLLKKREDEAPPPPPAKRDDAVLLLEEIRDLLKDSNAR
ncbi:MAG: large-conductance mechanosensitive channel protein MscL [Clostridiales bacterium]|jgi:large conductance mechanosensitive channel|nr:large-conductance mechanosensitive channel protein MscL [Clostridiales bacterium]